MKYLISLLFLGLSYFVIAQNDTSLLKLKIDTSIYIDFSSLEESYIPDFPSIEWTT